MSYLTIIVFYILYRITYLTTPLVITHTILPNYENKPEILGFIHRKFQRSFSYCWLLPYCHTHVCVCVMISPISFSYKFYYLSLISIVNDSSLITANRLSMTPFKWSVWGVVYWKSTFYFLRTFCNFDWCNPALSQCRYLTRVTHDFIF